MAGGPYRLRDGHSSGTPVTRRLQQPTRTARSGHRPGRLFALAPEKRSAVPIRSCSRWGLPCRGRCRPRGALLPHRFTLAAPYFPASGRGTAVCSLWHFPWARARRMLSGTACPRSPDFPPRHFRSLTLRWMQKVNDKAAGAAVRPTDRVRDGVAFARRQEARRANSRARAAMVFDRPRWASSSISVRRVDGSVTPSTRAGRKWR